MDIALCRNNQSIFNLSGFLGQGQSEMSRKHNPKPPYPAQSRQQMIDLVATVRKPSELARDALR